MALTTCKECGSQISTQARACPKCGAKVPRFKWWLWVPLGLVAAFLGFGALVDNGPQAKEKSTQRAAIKLCWEEQSRKSLDPASQRFVAGACEMMERRFEQAYGVRP